MKIFVKKKFLLNYFVFKFIFYIFEIYQSIYIKRNILNNKKIFYLYIIFYLLDIFISKRKSLQGLGVMFILC